MSGIPPTPTDAGPGELPAWNVQRDGLEPGHCPCGSRLSGIGARCANCRQDLCADCSESTKNCENCGANICPTCAPTARYEDVACRIPSISREYTCEACAAEEDANLRRDYGCSDRGQKGNRVNEIRGFVCAKCANGFPDSRKLTFGEAEICIDCANLIADEGEMVLMAELLEAKIIKPESLGDDGEK